MCGRIFNYYNGPSICTSCKEKLEKKFQEVKAYIRENPGVGIAEVAETCDVDPGQIRQWLREERLELAESSPILMQCESCGAEIRSGRFCEKCKNKTASGLQSILDADKPKPQPKTKTDRDKEKMRFL
jgi:transposase-like protein